jgi:hypothetical protein
MQSYEKYKIVKKLCEIFQELLEVMESEEPDQNYVIYLRGITVGLVMSLDKEHGFKGSDNDNWLNYLNDIIEEATEELTNLENESKKQLES